MLERTAASLESCSLQRVLPKSAKRCRQLHTGFWQHGASAIDLSSANALALPPRPGCPEPTEEELGSRQLESTLIASVFLLDFLYPSSTLPLLRRIYPKLPTTQERQAVNVITRRRLYSSSSTTNALQGAESSTSNPSSLQHERTDEGESPSGNSPDAVVKSRNESNDVDSTSPSIPNAVPELASSNDDSEVDVRTLTGLLDEGGYEYQEAWTLYSHLDHDKRLALRSELVLYLSKSHGIVETGRAVSVFRQIPVDEWDEDLLTAGVILLIRSGDLSLAIEQFKLGLKSKQLTGGLDYLLADTISSRDWLKALDVWAAFYAAMLDAGVSRKNIIKRLQHLDTLPNQGSLYFAFRAHLASEGASYRNTFSNEKIAGMAFRAFRRNFAERALLEPCPPEQAEIILDALKDAELYNTYFIRMFDRWYEKKESRTTVQKLPDLYQKFRELPDVVPDNAVLRGMFKVNFPKNIGRLEQLYDDWVRFKGTLNQWGYEKFLKLYAGRGDVPTVRRIWAEYVAKFPDALRTPRGFRSTLNVYAQVGNVEENRREIREMKEKYGVEPDVNCWNTLIKAYMRNNDYDNVLATFDTICESYEPNSFTYAHVMAMSSKKGDLETTLEFFRRSQEAQVPISKEIALSLVVAYCQNELIPEAENLCAELTERKLTHTAIWNQLINFNGMEGRLDRCYTILRRMREYNVEWDDETYGFLLQALIKQNQIHPAFSLVKRAEKEGLFTVTPEHFAAVMAGAARIGEYKIVESLHYRLQKSNLPVSFGALVTLVDASVRRRPGSNRSKTLAQEFVEYFRKAGGTANTRPDADPPVDSTANVAQMNDERKEFGRAISLLVELREFGTAEELMTLYTEVFPQYKKSEEYPPNVVSALMLAYLKDEQYEIILDLWEKTWERVLSASTKRTGEGVYAGTEYDLSRVFSVLVRSFRQSENPKGLLDCLEKITNAGFKLTRANWIQAVKYLAEMDRWERAMYWCETKLMDGWQGWGFERTGKTKRELQNTRMLKAPKYIVFRLQRKWLELRSLAAWSEDISRQLRHVEEKYPRLHHAFSTSDIENTPSTYVLNGKEVPLRDLDNVLGGMSYQELKKAKEALVKQQMQQRKRERNLGAASAPKTGQEEMKSRRMLQDKVRRYASKWAQRRRTEHGTAEPEGPENEAGNVSVQAGGLQDLDQHDADQRSDYWNNFWDRYDQRPHGATSAAETRHRQRYDNRGSDKSPRSTTRSRQTRSNDGDGDRF